MLAYVYLLALRSGDEVVDGGWSVSYPLSWLHACLFNIYLRIYVCFLILVDICRAQVLCFGLACRHPELSRCSQLPFGGSLAHAWSLLIDILLFGKMAFSFGNLWKP